MVMEIGHKYITFICIDHFIYNMYRSWQCFGCVTVLTPDVPPQNGQFDNLNRKRLGICENFCRAALPAGVAFLLATTQINSGSK